MDYIGCTVMLQSTLIFTTNTLFYSLNKPSKTIKMFWMACLCEAVSYGDGRYNLT